jgi:hypothetical protein
MSDTALMVIILGLGFFALIGWLAYLSIRYTNKPED